MKWRKIIPSRRNSKCKGAEVGTGLFNLREKRKETGQHDWSK